MKSNTCPHRCALARKSNRKHLELVQSIVMEIVSTVGVRRLDKLLRRQYWSFNRITRWRKESAFWTYRQQRDFTRAETLKEIDPVQVVGNFHTTCTMECLPEVTRKKKTLYLISILTEKQAAHLISNECVLDGRIVSGFSRLKCTQQSNWTKES